MNIQRQSPASPCNDNKTTSTKMNPNESVQDLNSPPSLSNPNELNEFEDHPASFPTDEEITSLSSGDFNNNNNNNSEDDEDDYTDDEEDDDDDETSPLSLEELLYSASSYHAIVRPVSTTMILAALASVYINNDASRAFGEEQFASAYNVWQVDTSNSGGNVGMNLLASIGNTFIMVLVIGTMTFGIVLLYKYR
jgi:hypothetical protein